MNTSELVRQLAKLLDIPQHKAKQLLYQELDAIAEELARGNEVIVRGFGKFSPRRVKTGKNAPQGDTTASFKAAPALRDGVKGWRPS